MACDDDNLKMLETAIQAAHLYPINRCGIEAHDHTLLALKNQLEDRSQGLFCADHEAQLHVFEMYRQDDGYRSVSVSALGQLQACLQLSLRQRRPDPRQRYIFISAPNSRAPLRLTKQMLLEIMTYHQIAPAFLDFVFPFGNQHYVRDFFSGFRSETRYEIPCQSQVIDLLGRSGSHIELFYNLKSVEQSGKPNRIQGRLTEPADTATHGWSVRQCSIHHRYDLNTQQSSWVIVKANKRIQIAIQKILEKNILERNQTRQSGIDSFIASLVVHRTICEWAGESWHWYINELDSTFQEKTRRTLFHNLEYDAVSNMLPEDHRPDSAHVSKLERKNTWLGRAYKRSNSLFTWREDAQTLQSGSKYNLQPVPPKDIPVAIDDFNFGDLQEVQRFEDKVNGVLLNLRSNSNVLRDLGREYTLLADREEVQSAVLNSRKKDIAAFSQQLSSIDKDLVMQQSRLETLLKMAADRKALIQGILSYRNMQATRLLAEKAQESAQNMEDMTVQMHAMARKNLVEAVSMRIITVVTLIFLPGTFISTLMSTPIIHFDEPTAGFSSSNIGVGALQLYLIVSLPLMCLTIFAWYGLYLREKRKEAALRSGELHVETGGYASCMPPSERSLWHKLRHVRLVANSREAERGTRKSPWRCIR